MSEATDQVLLPEEQKELEAWAAKWVTRWGKPEKKDYDFSSWMDDPKVSEPGCFWEYARESFKLRCLLRMIKYKPEEAKTHPLYLSCVFEGFREEQARMTLGGALRWLEGFADELAKNMSFVELRRAKENDVKRSLGEHPLRFPKLTAVQLAIPFPGDYEPPWPWQPWSHHLFDAKANPNSRRLPWRLPDRARPKNNGSEKIAIQIRWRNFTNSQIAAEMKRFAARERPQNEPEPKAEKPQETIRANLKALSVLRIWKRFPKAKHLRQRIREVAKFTGYKGCKDYVVAHRQAFREGQYDPKTRNARTEMSDARARALSFFQSLFPGETPSNF